MKERRSVLGLIALLGCLVLAGCGGGGSSDTTATFDASTMEQSPAAFFSLETGAIIPAKKAFETKQVAADLWIEPEDPELSGINEQRKTVKHEGQNTRVAVLDSADYAATTALPQGVEWKRELDNKEIVAGTVFLVQSSSGKFYKVKIDEATSELITLTYAEVK